MVPEECRPRSSCRQERNLAYLKFNATTILNAHFSVVENEFIISSYEQLSGRSQSRSKSNIHGKSSLVLRWITGPFSGRTFENRGLRQYEAKTNVD